MSYLGAVPVLSYSEALKSPTVTSTSTQSSEDILKAFYAAKTSTTPTTSTTEPTMTGLQVAQTSRGAQALAPVVSRGPNYLLWGGVALVAAVGGYLLFFRKKGKRQ